MKGSYRKKDHLFPKCRCGREESELKRELLIHSRNVTEHVIKSPSCSRQEGNRKIVRESKDLAADWLVGWGGPGEKCVCLCSMPVTFS